MREREVYRERNIEGAVDNIKALVDVNKRLVMKLYRRKLLSSTSRGTNNTEYDCMMLFYSIPRFRIIGLKNVSLTFEIPII